MIAMVMRVPADCIVSAVMIVCVWLHFGHVALQ
jgi:hypothetical protein